MLQVSKFYWKGGLHGPKILCLAVTYTLRLRVPQDPTKYQSSIQPMVIHSHHSQLRLDPSKYFRYYSAVILASVLGTTTLFSHSTSRPEWNIVLLDLQLIVQLKITFACATDAISIERSTSTRGFSACCDIQCHWRPPPPRIMFLTQQTTTNEMQHQDFISQKTKECNKSPQTHVFVPNNECIRFSWKNNIIHNKVLKKY